VQDVPRLKHAVPERAVERARPRPGGDDAGTAVVGAEQDERPAGGGRRRPLAHAGRGRVHRLPQRGVGDAGRRPQVLYLARRLPQPQLPQDPGEIDGRGVGELDGQAPVAGDGEVVGVQLDADSPVGPAPLPQQAGEHAHRLLGVGERHALGQPRPLAERRLVQPPEDHDWLPLARHRAGLVHGRRAVEAGEVREVLGLVDEQHVHVAPLHRGSDGGEPRGVLLRWKGEPALAGRRGHRPTSSGAGRTGASRRSVSRGM
jgi:hypothetical protein